MSGLKVNYHKSMLVNINIDDSWLIEAASILSVKLVAFLLCILAFLLVVMLDV